MSSFGRIWRNKVSSLVRIISSWKCDNWNSPVEASTIQTPKVDGLFGPGESSLIETQWLASCVERYSPSTIVPFVNTRPSSLRTISLPLFPASFCLISILPISSKFCNMKLTRWRFQLVRLYRLCIRSPGTLKPTDQSFVLVHPPVKSVSITRPGVSSSPSSS